MAKYAIIKSFYASTRWIKFRAMIIAERGMKCEKCLKLITTDKDAELDHIIELTPDNVHDVSISLNPDNVRLLHHDCHDARHNRFGNVKGKQVYIVYGCPGSGKTTYVNRNRERTDIIVCMDNLFNAITGLPLHDKPDQLLSNVRAIHTALLDQVKTRYGKWSTAWVVGGYADKYKREKLAEELGAELIYCECSKEEAMARIEMDDRRRNMIAEYRKYVDEWFGRYTC
ncbi:AAA family ATPase [Sporomusa malonica]|uniref:HNH endonuclease n=1 Tax=Sporomusa malonica TaxID=112901 RepID=A0A1W2ARW6_9FIRM|nr:HNH endonuclease [Sporomusa malonica]SMC63457.1 HNH endonuclease [Sporomusa malonica]